MTVRTQRLILQSSSARWWLSRDGMRALVVVFCEGLNPDLKAEMACRETNITLSQYITTAIHLTTYDASTNLLPPRPI